MHQLLWSGGWGFTDDMLIAARGTAAPACLHFFRVSSVHAAAADQSSCNCRGVAAEAALGGHYRCWGVFGEARRCHEAGEGAGYTKDEFAKRTLSKYVRSFGTGCPLVVRVVQTTGGAVLLGRSIALFVGRIENHTCPLSWMATW